jgi:hypothetical protein
MAKVFFSKNLVRIRANFFLADSEIKVSQLKIILGVWLRYVNDIFMVVKSELVALFDVALTRAGDKFSFDVYQKSTSSQKIIPNEFPHFQYS